MKKIRTAILLLITTMLLAGLAAAEPFAPESREDFRETIQTKVTLSEDEKKLDAVLIRMKQEADQLYPENMSSTPVSTDLHASGTGLTSSVSRS